jgi:Trypsin-co-occurring domain 1
VEDGPNRVRVDMGDAALYIEAYNLYPESARGFGEEQDVAAVKPDMTEVIQAIREFSGRPEESLGESGATRFAVEFGCELALETGRLVAVLAEARAKSTLRATLEWGQSSP